MAGTVVTLTTIINYSAFCLVNRYDSSVDIVASTGGMEKNHNK